MQNVKTLITELRQDLLVSSAGYGARSLSKLTAISNALKVYEATVNAKLDKLARMESLILQMGYVATDRPSLTFNASDSKIAYSLLDKVVAPKTTMNRWCNRVASLLYDADPETLIQEFGVNDRERAYIQLRQDGLERALLHYVKTGKITLQPRKPQGKSK